MKFKRLLASFFAATMCFSMLPAVVSADEVAPATETSIVETADQAVLKLALDDASPAVSPSPSPTTQTGKCGKSLTYAISGSTLLISGSGSMYSYKAGKAPWYAKRTQIKSVKIGSKVTSVGNYAFYGLSVTKVSGGSGLKTIGSYAFKNTKKLKSFSITSKKLKKIGKYAFAGSALKTLNISKTTKLTKKGVKKSLKKSSIKKVNVKNSKRFLYSYYFAKFNSGKKVKVS